MTEAPYFASPSDDELLQMPLAPRLASWNAAGDPEQVCLASYLDSSEALLRPKLEALPGPLAVRLDVGLPTSVELLAEHDLDNYALPLVARIARATGGQFVSVWCSKRHAPVSLVGVVTATAATRPAFDQSLDVSTTASASTVAYKRQISAQVATAEELPPGPVSLHLSFCVGPQRNWTNLWKPTIDSLEQLLGRTRPDREWHPRDGRVTELGLHCEVDAAGGNSVTISIGASPA